MFVKYQVIILFVCICIQAAGALGLGQPTTATTSTPSALSPAGMAEKVNKGIEGGERAKVSKSRHTFCLSCITSAKAL